MRVPPVLSLRDAVLTIIKGLPAVMGPCDGRVFDQVPVTAPLPKLPLVACGPALEARRENGDDGLKALRLRIFIASARPARDEAWQLAQVITDALEGACPDIGGGFRLIDNLRVEQRGDTLDKLSPSEVFVDVSTMAQSV